MKVFLTGKNGFLASKLLERDEVEWVDSWEQADMMFLLGSPTYTNPIISSREARVLHNYVKSTMRQIDDFTGPIIFASTTGVNDIQLDHGGSTPYNLAKLFLEDYLMHSINSYMILRIGTIVSSHKRDVDRMKPDRVQPKIHRGIFDVENEDYYLDVDTFVDTTIKYILNFESGIKEYKLIKLSKTQLMFMGRKND
jgi:nucleoside-diphosphate-sugar epimerase